MHNRKSQACKFVRTLIFSHCHGCHGCYICKLHMHISMTDIMIVIAAITS